MSKAATKTNNSEAFVEAKIQMRINSLPNKERIDVLELFGGNGVLWGEVKKRTKKKINILSIDKNTYERVQLRGDNMKFLIGLNINGFDIIDVDAWGVPAKQLDFIFKQNYKGIIHLTLIMQNLASIPKEIYLKSGITKKMYKKCKTIFLSKSQNIIENWLYCQGITGITGITGIKHNGMIKNYFYFKL